MVKSLVYSLFILLAGLLFWQCQATIADPEIETVYIVNAYLYTGRSIDSVFISRNTDVMQPYTYEGAAVTADSVIIIANGHRFRLEEHHSRRGAYYLPADSHLVTPGFTYGLRVHIGSHLVSAETVAPDTVAITDQTVDTTYFPYPNPFRAKTIRVSWAPADFAAGYDISVICRTPRQLVDIGFEHLIAQLLEQNDYDTLGTFPPVRDFPVADTETSSEIFWDSFYYYGDYTIKVYAVDNNLWDLASSNIVYQGQDSEYEQPAYNIEGGYGLFAALSVDSTHVHILK